ncbi:MAG: chromosomal replication initiator protein DnaA [Clostridia bacterium]|nr:chromosomal replication initiator protein DnaA [Clostridia bacterium]
MNSAADIWAMVLKIMTDNLNVNEITINTWFKDTSAISFDNNKLVIVTPVKYIKERILSMYKDKILEALKLLFSMDIDFDVYAENEISSEPVKKVVTDSDFSFEDFVIGNSNQFACAAAKAVAENPANAYNPLTIYSGPGLGKTHLINAIASTIKATNPDTNVVCINSEIFINEFIECVRDGEIKSFQNKYRNADVLLVDDIQFIAGKERTQEEFFYTFNALYDAGKQIVLTSDRPPKEIATLEERLRSRFEAGLIIDINPPDYETRMAIISLKATRLGLDLSEDLRSLIANKITSNVRQLEGVAKKILAQRDLVNAPINEETVNNAIESVFQENPGLNPTMEMVVAEVSKFYQIEVEQIMSKSRVKEIVNARHVSIYLIKKIIKNSSYPSIGKFFNCDHSSAMHSYNKVKNECAKNEEFKNQLKDIKSNIIGS